MTGVHAGLLTFLQLSLTLLLMELTKTIAEKLGNVFINIGQGVILGSLVSGLFGSEFRVALLLTGLSLGVYTIYSGLVILSQSKHMEG